SPPAQKAGGVPTRRQRSERSEGAESAWPIRRERQRPREDSETGAVSDCATRFCTLRHGIPGQSPVSRKLLWDEHLRHLKSREAHLVDFDGVSGWTRRSFGLQKPAVHVGRDAERPVGLWD